MEGITERTSIVVRIVMIVSGFPLAWFAMWSGNKVHTKEDGQLLYALAYLGAIVLALNLIEFVASIFGGRNWTRQTYVEFSYTIGSLFCVTFSMFFFGAIVAPIGRGIEAWLTPWDLLLVLGGVPLLLVIEDIVTDIAATKLAKSFV